MKLLAVHRIKLELSDAREKLLATEARAANETLRAARAETELVMRDRRELLTSLGLPTQFQVAPDGTVLDATGKPLPDPEGS